MSESPDCQNESGNGVEFTREGTPTDPAPTVYDADGNPLKVRVIGGQCEGDASGEGHYAYTERVEGEMKDCVTVWFQEVSEGE